jgi:hypothetical protein
LISKTYFFQTPVNNYMNHIEFLNNDVSQKAHICKKVNDNYLLFRDERINER